MAVSFGGVLVDGISESDGGRTSVTGVVLCLVAAVCYAGGVVRQKLALRHSSAVQATTFGCFTCTTTKLLSYFRSMSLPASRRRWFVSFILPASPHRHDPRDGITDQCKYAGRRTSGAICG
jgi:drug/metabolite transporter (DMT)-like permease